MSDTLDRIFTAIETGKCLAFLGAGASGSYSKNGEKISGLPDGGRLVKIIADKCGLNNSQYHDLAKIAEYFVYTRNGDRGDLENLLQQTIYAVPQPRPIHTAIAQLTLINIIITSNYDLMLETALNTYGRTTQRHVYDPQDTKTGHFEGKFFWNEKDIILHKMHGSIDNPRSLVITESDYIRYLASLTDIDRGMPEYFRKFVIPQHTLLFLGYSLEDWNFRVIWEGVLSSYHATGAPQRDAFALVKDPQDFQRNFWARRNIDIIKCDLTDFAMKLAKQFNLEIPQLGIQKAAEDSA